MLPKTQVAYLDPRAVAGVSESRGFSTDLEKLQAVANRNTGQASVFWRGGIYNYSDELDLMNALMPTNAASAEIALLYQGTSWEYIQFL